MATNFISERNLTFLLYEVFDVLELTKYDYYQDHDREMFDMVLKTSVNIANDLFFPHLEEMDRNPPQLVAGKIRVHPSVKEFLKVLGESGWIGSIFPEQYGGFQLPIMVANLCNFIFSAANYSASAYAGLTTGAAGLIITFGDKDLIDTFVPKMVSGEWQGTMALTEPQAGSSLADIQTAGEPTTDGYYKIRGRKIFISAGDHDGVSNIIHLMLAKIKGAPPGIRGISLFVVPKYRISENGELVSNDIVTSEIYHKMGYRGTPITGLSLGEQNNCRGYLVGKPHHGLPYMFRMMNEARIGVGFGAAAIASAAYYASRDYARERLQGRRLTQKDPTLPQVPIIEHADIKRMLLFQRAIVEGSLSLLVLCSKYVDLIKVSTGEDKENYELLLDILTPLAKSYPSEMAIHSVSQSLQCLGGYGYCNDFPVEQYYRDVRIHPIHEGTTGIQAMDLLGRKIMIKDGRAFVLYLSDIKHTIKVANGLISLQTYAGQLRDAVRRLEEVTGYLIHLAQSHGSKRFLADAMLYLELFGIITIAWQWLLQGIVAHQSLEKGGTGSDGLFYQGKLYTMRYFFAYELPKSIGLSLTLKELGGLTTELNASFF